MTGPLTDSEFEAAYFAAADLPPLWYAAMPPQQGRGRVLRIGDGDTFAIDQGKRFDYLRVMPVRLASWDAAELDDDRPDVKAMAEQARDAMLDLLTNKRVILTAIKRDKFFRLNTSVQVGKYDLGDLLAAKGLVRPYIGGRGARPW